MGILRIHLKIYSPECTFPPLSFYSFPFSPPSSLFYGGLGWPPPFVCSLVSLDFRFWISIVSLSNSFYLSSFKFPWLSWKKKGKDKVERQKWKSKVERWKEKAKTKLKDETEKATVKDERKKPKTKVKDERWKWNRKTKPKGRQPIMISIRFTSFSTLFPPHVPSLGSTFV